MKIGDIVIVNEFKETDDLIMTKDMYLHVGKKGVIQNIDKSDGSCKVFDWWWTKESITFIESEVDSVSKLKEILSNVITAVEKERKLSGKGKQLPVIKEAYSVLKSLK